MAKRMLLENYYLLGAFEAQVEALSEHYNLGRYDESIDNLTPADVNFGRGAAILAGRERIKQATID